MLGGGLGWRGVLLRWRGLGSGLLGGSTVGGRALPLPYRAAGAALHLLHPADGLLLHGL